MFSPPYFSPTADLPAGMMFPLVIKLMRGMRSVGIVTIRDEKTLRRFLRARRSRYIAQHFMREALEIGVSYTRNPSGSPVFLA
jgi:glutathione synthase/RimK-type ligase-like ATP-grasp enzyme